MNRVFINNTEIIQVTNIDVENVTNWFGEELTTGQTAWGAKDDKSMRLTISTILDDDQKKTHEAIYNNLRKLSKKQSLSIVADNLSFMGIIEEISSSISGEQYKTEYDIIVSESKAFTTSFKEINTFTNTVQVVPASTNSVSYLIHLVRSVDLRMDCAKNKNDSNVYNLQDLLRLEGYYVWDPVSYKPYNRDGWWCELMNKEYLRWQENELKIVPDDYLSLDVKKYIIKKYGLDKVI